MDRISYLPDPIRSHIVSFLPFKDAIRTSILSQQWRHVCSSLSNLDFRQIEHIKYDGREGRERFKSIIDQTLILHDGSDIQKFYFKIRPAEDDPISLLQINAWISFALRHNVKNLGLDIAGFGEDLKFGYNGTKPPDILIELPKVETLVLLDYFIQFFNWDQSLLASLPTPCASVKNLLLGMDASINQGHLVAFLLRSCPNIQVLCIMYPWHKTLPLEMSSVIEWHMLLTLRVEQTLFRPMEVVDGAARNTNGCN
ncbi:F-box/RNI-like superfamily protein [Thalictrum thalictroides]|uniref:F-box/RNI-like superfamily protein n=1 Tax=Thalictrum thalictroides TaxID=46969 RepID=A0A7J6XBU8_THATH|nr:F-box/RNI-like superfamily protein [Thalictrum thalictroides]